MSLDVSFGLVCVCEGGGGNRDSGLLGPGEEPPIMQGRVTGAPRTRWLRPVARSNSSTACTNHMWGGGGVFLRCDLRQPYFSMPSEADSF